MEAFFGGGGGRSGQDGGGGRPRGVKGSSLRIKVKLNYEEIANGTTRKSVKVKKACCLHNL